VRIRLISWGPAAVWAAVLFLLSAFEDVPGTALFPFADKVGHLGLYAVLGAALTWGRWRSGGKVPVLGVLAVGAVYAVSDEWHQSFVPGRDASMGDWAADILGLALGYWLASTILRRR
jgi:VanZ family protein